MNSTIVFVKARHFLPVVVLFILAVTVDAESQKATPGPGGEQPPSKAESYYSPPQSSEEHPPSAVIIDESGEQKNAQNQAEEHDGKTPTDWWLIRFTAALVVVGLLQAWILYNQVRHFRRIERAYVFVSVKHFAEGFEPSPPEEGLQYHVLIWISNGGKTPAIMTSLRALAAVRESYPTKHSISETLEIIPPGGFIVKGGEDAEPIKAPVRISSREWKAISEQHGTMKLLCYGTVKYKDIFGKDHNTGFCWEWSPHESHRCFYISKNDELNYHT